MKRKNNVISLQFGFYIYLKLNVVSINLMGQALSFVRK